MDLHPRRGMAYVAGIAIGVTAQFLAFGAIRQSLVEQQREWMIRSYVVTFAFVIFRIGDLTCWGWAWGNDCRT